MTARLPAAPRLRSPAVAGILVAVGVAVVSLVCIFLIRGGRPVAPLPRYALIQGGFAAAGLAGWIIAIARPSWVPARITAAAATLAVASLIASFASVGPGLSMPATWDLVMKGGTALALCEVAHFRTGRRILIGTAAVVLAAVTAAYLLDVASKWLQWYRSGMPLLKVPLRPGNVGGIASIPTVMADEVLVIAPLVVVAAWRLPRFGRALAVLLALTATACVIISGTRSLWLLAAGFFVLVAIGWVRTHLNGKRARTAVSVAVVVLPLIVMLGLADQVSRSLDEGRTSAFGTSFEMFARSPVLGTGPATYPLVRLSESIPILAHYAFPNAHNIVLTTMGETGLLGLVGLAIAAVLIGSQLWRTWRTSPSTRPYIVAAMGGAAIVLGHAMSDVVIEKPGVLVLLFIVGALGLVPAPEDADDEERSDARRSIGDQPTARSRMDSVLVSRVAGIVGLAVLVAVAPRTLAFERSLVAQDAVERTALSNPTAALARARQAVDLQPDSALAVDQTMVLADRTGDSAAAIAAARRLVELEGLAQHRVELAILLERAGQHESAVAEMRAALARDGVDPFVQLNGAVLLSAEGDPAGAETALERLVVAQPFIGLQASGLPPAVASLLPAATSKAMADLESAGQWSDALAAALTGDPSAADAVVAAAPADQRTSLAQVRDGWAGSEPALAALETSLRADPTDATTMKWAWLLESRDCNATEANRWRNVLRLFDGERFSVPVAIGALQRAPSMRPAGYPTYLYPVVTPAAPYVAGTWTYRGGSPVCIVR